MFVIFTFFFETGKNLIKIRNQVLCGRIWDFFLGQYHPALTDYSLQCVCLVFFAFLENV